MAVDAVEDGLLNAEKNYENLEEKPDEKLEILTCYLVAPETQFSDMDHPKVFSVSEQLPQPMILDNIHLLEQRPPFLGPEREGALINGNNKLESPASRPGII